MIFQEDGNGFLNGEVVGSCFVSGSRTCCTVPPVSAVLIRLWSLGDAVLLTPSWLCLCVAQKLYNLRTLAFISI
jgi:hypothetical protein